MRYQDNLAKTPRKIPIGVDRTSVRYHPFIEAADFSDIHNDWKTLEERLDVQADFYIAAGDQVTWAKGFERCGEILGRRGNQVYVLPGNHESSDDIASMCARFGLHNFHEQHIEIGRWQVAGLGYSSPTPFDTPGEYSEPQMAARLAKFADLDPLVLVCTRRLMAPRSTRFARASMRARARCASSSRNRSRFISSAATYTRRKESRSASAAHWRAT